jgi:hypothetical protein
MLHSRHSTLALFACWAAQPQQSTFQGVNLPSVRRTVLDIRQVLFCICLLDNNSGVTSGACVAVWQP